VLKNKYLEDPFVWSQEGCVNKLSMTLNSPYIDFSKLYDHVREKCVGKETTFDLHFNLPFLFDAFRETFGKNRYYPISKDSYGSISKDSYGSFTTLYNIDYKDFDLRLYHELEENEFF